MKNELVFLRKIRSFVRRDGRMTDAQRRVLTEYWPHVGLELKNEKIHLPDIFQREAPCILEIGFGSGHSLLAMAKTNPQQNFIGIETHQPGIGTLLLGMEAGQVSNVRIYYADAVEVLEQCIPECSLDTVQLFFPDPWPKRRHHKRRLIQLPFVKLIAKKLKENGTLHLATDWEDYAIEMMKVLSSAEEFSNIAGKNEFSNRSPHRPIVTKFERRGQSAGRQIWELQFVKRVAPTKSAGGEEPLSCAPSPPAL